MRDTCATLWLAAGESRSGSPATSLTIPPQMLFRVYARFVPNLTRKDGSAFERLLLQAGTLQQVGVEQAQRMIPLPGDCCGQDGTGFEQGGGSW